MRAHEFINQSNLYEIDRRGFLRALGAGAATAALGTAGYNALKEPPPPPPVAKPEPFRLKFSDVNPLRDNLVKKARAAGIKEFELAHLISQVAHETGNFKKLEEVGSPRYFKQYERGIGKNKKTGKPIPNRLGNLYPGDGARFKGRGFIHLTGRENYRRAGQALGLPLEERPELAADPEHAADIAIWFWTKRVQSKVSDFDAATVQQVTKPINPGLKGLQDREAQFTRLTQR